MPLLSRFIPAPAVATAAGVSVGALRSWVDREAFATPLPVAEAGKPRNFPLLAVYEAAMLAWGSDRDVLSLIRGAWFFRKHATRGAAYFHDPAAVAEIVSDEAFIAAAKGGGFPEFRPAGEDLFWLVLMEADGQQSAGGVLVGTLAELAPRATRGGLLIPVSALVRQVDARLATLATA